MSMSRDGLLPPRFGHLHRKFGTPAFATIVTGFLVGIPALFAPSGIITDLTSIGTLFAFTLVCGGVLLLPRLDRLDATGRKRFQIPYINGRFLLPLLVLFYFYVDNQRLLNAVMSMHMDRQAVLLAAFAVFALGTAVQAFRRRYSLIPCIGMLSCAYLMIEIPVKSWEVFFGWMALGLLIYFFYSRGHSKLREG